MPATIKDVSKKANVSISTVSHVLNGTRFVSEETTQRVLKAIEEVGYVPNIVAKNLKKSATNTIGLVVSDVRNQFFIDIISVIDKEARNDGIQVFVSGSGDDKIREYTIIKNLVERRVDGIIYSPTKGSEEKTTGYLKKAGIPTVMIDRIVDGDFDWVGAESFESARTLVDYLADKGHKKISLLAGFSGINTVEERIAGFKYEMQSRKLDYRDEWVITGNYRNDPLAEQMIHMMTKKDHPTAIIGGNNRMIFSIMKALQYVGLSPKMDVEIVAFDVCEWADYFEPKITALEQPTDEIGRKAYQLLKNRMQHPDSPIQSIKLKPKLVIRDT